MPAPEQSPRDEFPRIYNPQDNEYEAAIAFSGEVAIPQTVALLEPPSTEDTIGTNPLFVRRYLVLLHATAEDFPVGLFENPDEAVEFARDVHNDPNVHADRYLDALETTQTAILRREWISVSVIEFSGPVAVHRSELFLFD